MPAELPHLTEADIARIRPQDPRRSTRGIKPRVSRKRYTGQMIGYLTEIGKLKLTEPVKVAGHWLEPMVDTRRHHMHLAVAERGGGKSVTIAKIAELYHKGTMRPVILDLIDGGSGESLCWAIKAARCPVCKSRVSPIVKKCPGVKLDATECGADLPGVPEGMYPVILVIPDGMRFSAPDWADVTPVPASEAELAELLSMAKKGRKVVVFGWSFFRGRNKETALSLLSDWCLGMDDATDSVDVDVAVVIREAATYLFSRIKTWRAENEFKPQVLRLIREARHQSRSIILLDSQRWTDVDSAIRTRSDRVWVGVQPASQIMKEGLDWAIYNIDRRQRRAAQFNRFFAWEAFPNIGFLQPWQKYCLWPAREELLLVSPFPMPEFHCRMEREFPKHFGFEYSLEGVGLQLGVEQHARGGPPAPGSIRAPGPETIEQIIARTAQETRRRTLLEAYGGFVRTPGSRRGAGLNNVELQVLNSLLDRGISQRDIVRSYHFSPGTISAVMAERRAQVQVGTARVMRSAVLSETTLSPESAVTDQGDQGSQEEQETEGTEGSEGGAT